MFRRSLGITLKELLDFVEEKQLSDFTRIHIYTGKEDIYLPARKVMFSGMYVKFYPIRYSYQEGIGLMEFKNECDDTDLYELKLKSVYGKINSVEVVNNLVMLK